MPVIQIRGGVTRVKLYKAEVAALEKAADILKALVLVEDGCEEMASSVSDIAARYADYRSDGQKMLPLEASEPDPGAKK